MKNSLKCYSIIALAVTLIAMACKKSDHSGAENALAAYQLPPNIRVNQAITIYDSTALSDSPRYFQPPLNHHYRWTISPADPAAVIGGSYQYGKADIIFNHAGAYNVKADIYDSLDQHLLGHTEPVAVQVSSDSLYPSEPLQAGDQLIGNAFTLPYGHDTVILSVNFTTVKSYLNYGGSTVLRSSHTYTDANNIDFADSAYLATFPFAYYSARQQPVTCGLLLGFIGPDTESLNIKWLGTTYSGTINVDANGKLTLDWNNSGPVQLNLNR